MKPEGPKPQILVVDDDDELRDSLVEVLRDEGFGVASVCDGRAALDYLRHNPAPSVVVLDLMMPVMSGAEFREVQLADKEMATIPVVLLTATHDGRLRAHEMGAVAYFGKPIDLDGLIRVLRSM